MDDTAYGARQEAWHHFAGLLGLYADMLPVVSNPDAQISPDSKMRALGKTPSVYNFRRQAAGFPKWTEHYATMRDIGRWEVEPDYGIALQCRTIRAIDIDVPDQRKAAAICKAIMACLPCAFFPERHRDGTGKTLLAFRYPHPLPKRVIPVDGGVIEFLGDGQQFIAAGSYIDSKIGVADGRYIWRGGLPTDFPTLEPGELLLLWDTLCVTFATGEPRIARDRREPLEPSNSGWTGGDDPVADYLMEKWDGDVFDQGRSGELFIDCPFSDQHTTNSGPTATAYFPAGTGGYDRGHFVCLHAHCTGREDIEFKRAIGYERDQFPDLSDGGGPVARTGSDDSGRGADAGGRVRAPDREDDADLLAPVPVQVPVDWPKFVRDNFGRIEPTFDNMVKAVERPDMCARHIAFDKFQFGVVWAPGDQEGDGRQWRAWVDHDYVDLRISLERRGFKAFGIDSLRAVVNRVAQYNAVDTAQEWLSRVEWDGVLRIETFLPDMLGTVDTPYTRAMSRYIWTAQAGRILEPGVKADMVPVFKGPQGTGKSTAVEAIAPDEDFFVEINLMHRDDDTSRRLRSKLVGELGELRGLLSRDAEDVKAFITRRKESWVPKYMEMEATFFRRLLFYGSTNKDEFLGDETGERRWLPIATGTERAIDVGRIRAERDQLWAEGAVMFALGGIDFEEAERLAPAEHVKFKTIDPWYDDVARWLATPDNLSEIAPLDRKGGVSLSEMLEGAVGLRKANLDKTQEMRMGKIAKMLGGVRVRDWTDGGKARWKFRVERLASWAPQAALSD